MKKLHFFSFNDRVFFKRWENKSYSVFRSLGKIIIILMLPVVYLLSFSSAINCQDTLSLQNVVVHSIKRPILFNRNFRLVKIITEQEIRESGVDNITDLLTYALGVDVRRRGADDVQADVSLRGGSSDQVLIMVNGVPVSDPQTGHHSMVLPIDMSDVQSVEILQGPGTRLYGLNAFTGAINFIIKPHRKRLFLFKLTGGQYDYVKGIAQANFSVGKSENLLSVSKNFSSGYTENTDFDITKMFYSSNVLRNRYKFYFQTGVVCKSFGAYNFYTPAFPYQYEVINNEMASGRLVFGGGLKSAITVYYRRNQDKFELFRETKNWYEHRGDYWIKGQSDTAKYVRDMYIPAVYYQGHNYHVNHILGLSYYLNFSSKLGHTALGAEYRRLYIRSNVLGNKLDSFAVPFERGEWFTKYGSEDNVSLSIDHSLRIEKFDFSAGANVNYNTMFGFYTAFGLEMAFRENNLNFSYFSVNQGVRLPTFTDLYYKGPSNIGNDSLIPEKSTSFELGHKILSSSFMIQSAFFYRLGRDIIDWVRLPKQKIWRAMNYTKLNTFGFDFSTKIYMYQLTGCKFVRIIDLSYQYLRQSKQKQPYISRYVLDYPRNTFSVEIVHQLLKNLNISWDILYKERLGTYSHSNAQGVLVESAYKPYWLIDAGLNYRIKKVVFKVNCSNLLNVSYYDLSNVKLPGRWFKAGIELEL